MFGQLMPIHLIRLEVLPRLHRPQLHQRRFLLSILPRNQESDARGDGLHVPKHELDRPACEARECHFERA